MGAILKCRPRRIGENEGLAGADALIAEENRRLRTELEKVKAERESLRKAATDFAGKTN